MGTETAEQEPSDKLICQVCERNEAVGVASSPLGAISNAYCRECLQQEAEPLWLIHATIDIVELKHVAEWVKHIRSFKDGKYIEWNDIVACYTPDADLEV